jgi:hypothetical protein
MMNCLILETCQIRRGELCVSLPIDFDREEGGCKEKRPETGGRGCGGEVGRLTVWLLVYPLIIRLFCSGAHGERTVALADLDRRDSRSQSDVRKYREEPTRGWKQEGDERGGRKVW